MAQGPGRVGVRETTEPPGLSLINDKPCSGGSSLVWTGRGSEAPREPGFVGLTVFLPCCGGWKQPSARWPVTLSRTPWGLVQFPQTENPDGLALLAKTYLGKCKIAKEGKLYSCSSCCLTNLPALSRRALEHVTVGRQPLWAGGQGGKDRRLQPLNFFCY